MSIYMFAVTVVFLVAGLVMFIRGWRTKNDLLLCLGTAGILFFVNSLIGHLLMMREVEGHMFPIVLMMGTMCCVFLLYGIVGSIVLVRRAIQKNIKGVAFGAALLLGPALIWLDFLFN